MTENITSPQQNGGSGGTVVPAEEHWVTPEFTVVETALEVTAYSLNRR
ncbi:pyrroloquinoline quinone precursor peptide PqqA [Streptomyces sp. NPDC090025]